MIYPVKAISFFLIALCLSCGDKSNAEQAHNLYKGGKKSGLWKDFDEDGRLLSEGYFEDGLENGPMKWYHEKGHLAGEGEMKNGQRDGVWKVYAIEEERLMSEVIFREDKQVGIVRLYHENGKLKLENTWEGERIISTECWDEQGGEIDCPQN